MTSYIVIVQKNRPSWSDIIPGVGTKRIMDAMVKGHDVEPTVNRPIAQQIVDEGDIESRAVDIHLPVTLHETVSEHEAWSLVGDYISDHYGEQGWALTDMYPLDHPYANSFGVETNVEVKVSHSTEVEPEPVYALERISNGRTERLGMFDDYSSAANTAQLHVKMFPHSSVSVVKYAQPVTVGVFQRNGDITATIHVRCIMERPKAGAQPTRWAIAMVNPA